MCDANWFSIAWKSSLRGGNERKKKTVGFGIPAERWMQMSREVWESHYLSAWLAGLLVGCYFHLFHGRLCCSAIVAQLLLSPDWFFFSFSDTKLETRFLIFSQSSTSFSLPSGHNRSPQPKKKRTQERNVFPRWQVRIVYLAGRICAHGRQQLDTQGDVTKEAGCAHPRQSSDRLHEISQKSHSHIIGYFLK